MGIGGIRVESRNVRAPRWRALMKFLNEPTVWDVTLVSGQVVKVWSDVVGDLENPAVPLRFSSLMDIADEDQQWLQIEGRTPDSPDRVLVTIAEFPRDSVARINDLYRR